MIAEKVAVVLHSAKQKYDKMKTKMKLIIGMKLMFLLAAWGSVCGQASSSARRVSHEIFVSPSGKDSNPGTSLKPLRSIHKAVNKLEPGNILTLLDGVYDLEDIVTISAKGTSEKWITVRGARGAKVVLEGIKLNIVNSTEYPGNNGLIQIQNAEYIRIQNIHVRNSHRAGINIQDSKHIDVINCISENSLSPGISAWQRCEYIRVLGNTVINANDMKMSWTPFRGHEAPHEAISMAGPHHFEVAWNHVYNCDKEGIDVKETASFGVVHHNYVHDLKRQGLYIDGWFGQLQDIEMRDNVVTRCEAGIAVSSEEGPNTKNLRIHHNLVYNNRASGIFFSRWGADNPREDIKVYNNTFYRNGHGRDFAGDPQYWLSGGCYLYSTNLHDVRIFNNIFARNSPFEIGHTARLEGNWEAQKNILISNNLIQDQNTIDYPIYLHVFAKDSVYSMTGTRALQADPLFVDPDNGDFRLKENSPAVNAGYSDFEDATNHEKGYYLGTFPPDASRKDFWWLENFPPEIDIESYGK